MSPEWCTTFIPNQNNVKILGGTIDIPGCGRRKDKARAGIEPRVSLYRKGVLTAALPGH